MAERQRNAESTGELGRFTRRTMLKGAVGLVGTAGVAGTASAWENAVTLEAGDRPVEYVLVVSGEIRRGDAAEETDRIVDRSVAVGEMRETDDLDDAVDSYEFDGRLLDVTVLEGSLKRVSVNDRRVDDDLLDGEAVAVLEDFEDGEWPDDWVRETEGYEITDDPLVGRFAVEASGAVGYPDVRKPTAETPRGHTYTVRTVPGSAEAYPALLTNCQRFDVMDDCYAAWLRTGLDELLLQVRSGGRGTALGRVNARRSLSAGEEYWIALDVGDDWVRAWVLAGDGEVVAATDRHRDATHDGGTPGLYTDGTDEAVEGTRYDQCVRWPLGLS